MSTISLNNLQTSHTLVNTLNLLLYLILTLLTFTTLHNLLNYSFTLGLKCTFILLFDILLIPARTVGDHFKFLSN